jgi:hypothetical protein
MSGTTPAPLPLTVKVTLRSQKSTESVIWYIFLSRPLLLHRLRDFEILGTNYDSHND